MAAPFILVRRTVSPTRRQLASTAQLAPPPHTPSLCCFYQPRNLHSRTHQIGHRRLPTPPLVRRQFKQSAVVLCYHHSLGFGPLRFCCHLVSTTSLKRVNRNTMHSGKAVFHIPGEIGRLVAQTSPHMFQLFLRKAEPKTRGLIPLEADSTRAFL